MSTLYLHNSIFLDHEVPEGHPERPDRIRAIDHALENENFTFLSREYTEPGQDEDILRAHPEEHLALVRRAAPNEGRAHIDADTSMSPGTLSAALHAVGGATTAIDEVMTGKVNNAFVAARPPGHHAERTRVMGFCFFNNAAIAARRAQAVYGAERVAVIDFDVHHGNGTQDIFWDDPSVMYCSTHEMPLFPGTGAKDEVGAGNIVNAPLGPGTGSDGFREAVQSRILPALDNFAPDLVIISAGFDAHHRDPLATMQLVEEDYSWATAKLMDVANKHCDNRVVSLLEGGYDLVGLSRSVAVHVARLMSG
ncbi:histone deacetylase family protein [Coralliovum pocilloporae]|uniref:histone deacetylase family protein n=1 Tax=Coralliovum pocilloporae TaxID=3066369 RepID=UPI0033071E88